MGNKEMIKLTRAQQKDQARISAWQDNTPFKETSRSPARVPVMDTAQVMREYIPQSLAETGAYLTPLNMADEFRYWITSNISTSKAITVLDPCAGIGNLLYPWANNDQYELYANELSLESYNLGQKLLPHVHWSCNSILTGFDRLFDLVVMNPPFGIYMQPQPGGYTPSIGLTLSKKSEHACFEIAIRYTKPSGSIALLAPENFLDKLPARFASFVQDYTTFRMHVLMPGEFKFTKIALHAFLFLRRGVTLPPPVAGYPTIRWTGFPLTLQENNNSSDSSVPPGVDKTPLKVAPPPTCGGGEEEEEEEESANKGPDSRHQEATKIHASKGVVPPTPGGQKRPLQPMQQPRFRPAPPLLAEDALIVELPIAVHRDLSNAVLLPSIADMVRYCKSSARKDAAMWISSHPLEYGQLFYHGFKVKE